jgi:YOP proteins translocation protein K (YscK)
MLHELVGLKLSFNLFPAEYAHASWLAQLGLDAELPPPQPSPALRGGGQGGGEHSPLWLRAVSTALLRQRRLDSHFDCDFHDPAKRVALIDTTTLLRVGGLVLATLLRDRLRCIVQRSQVQALHDCMGIDAHQFALRWSGPVPVIPLRLDDGTTRITAESWLQRSVGQLFAVVPTHAIGVVERMRLRFPAQWTLPDPQQPRLTDGQREALVALVLGVIAESAPHWRWLFAADAAPAGRAN